MELSSPKVKKFLILYNPKYIGCHRANVVIEHSD